MSAPSSAVFHGDSRGTTGAMRCRPLGWGHKLLGAMIICSTPTWAIARTFLEPVSNLPALVSSAALGQRSSAGEERRDGGQQVLAVEWLGEERNPVGWGDPDPGADHDDREVGPFAAQPRD
jgi:hypothetical protein